MTRLPLVLALLLGACASPQPPGRIEVEVYRGLGGKAAGSFLPALEILIDATRSMQVPLVPHATRLQVAQVKAAELLRGLPAGVNAGLSVLGGVPEECAPLERWSRPANVTDPAQLAALAEVRTGAEGSVAGALARLAEDLRARGRARDTRVVVFTDLEPGCGAEDLCAAARTLVDSGAWLDVVAIGPAPAPRCLDELRPSEAEPGALVRALTRPSVAWSLAQPGSDPALSGRAGEGPREVLAGEWQVAVALDRPLEIASVPILPARTTRLRVLDFPGAPPRFAWEVLDERR
jgi:hypothetical protein